MEPNLGESEVLAWRGRDTAFSDREQRLRWALQTLRGGAWDWNLTTGEAWWSREMYDLWGVEHDAGMNLADSLTIVCERDRDRLRRAVEESIAQHADLRCEFRIVHSVLGERWMTSYGQPILDESGRVIRLVGITLDVTAQKQSEQALRASEARLELLATVSEHLLRSENPQEVIKELCRLVMAYLDCQVFFNYLVAVPDRTLYLNASAGVAEEAVDPIQQPEFGKVLLGCVASDAAPFVIEDIQRQDDPRVELLKSLGIRAYCCHPLRDQDRLIGTLSFGTQTRSAFTSDEIALMKSVTDQVAVAIQRVHTKEALGEALAKAEEGDQLLSALMEYVPEGITIADAALNLKRVSRYGQELLGGVHEGKSVERVVSEWKVCHAGRQHTYGL